MDISGKSALELGTMIKSREIGCGEALEASLDAIRGREDQLNAFIHVDEERAAASARRVQERLDAGEALSPLAGVPMAVKDNICVGGMPATCASKMLEGFRPPYGATAVERLEEAGAVVVGKLNMDEFAMGGSTETSYFGPTANPWDPERVPGGSSGGAAAAVASGEVPYALGSDTGGSIRQPCSFCGVSGIKPTYGAVSRYGLIAYASSLDQIGPVGRTVRDCAAVLAVMGGHDPRDSTSAARPAMDLADAFTGDVRGLRIGLPGSYFGAGVDPEVADAVRKAARQLADMGATVEQCDLPLADQAVAAYYIAACAEASSNLSRYDGIKYGYRSPEAEDLMEVYVKSRSEGFGMEVKRRIMLGAFVLSSGYYDAYYKKALQARGMIRRAFDGVFARFDMVLGPVAPTTAYKLGENLSDPLKMYLGDIFTVAVNLAGLPAVSVPCGFDGKGLPVGMQLIGKPFAEPVLVRAADAYQGRTAHHLARPQAVQGGAAL